MVMVSNTVAELTYETTDSDTISSQTNKKQPSLTPTITMDNVLYAYASLIYGYANSRHNWQLFSSFFGFIKEKRMRNRDPPFAKQHTPTCHFMSFDSLALFFFKINYGKSCQQQLNAK
jgi:hypothetical protein